MIAQDDADLPAADDGYAQLAGCLVLGIVALACCAGAVLAALIRGWCG